MKKISLEKGNQSEEREGIMKGGEDEGVKIRRQQKNLLEDRKQRSSQGGRGWGGPVT